MSSRKIFGTLKMRGALICAVPLLSSLCFILWFQSQLVDVDRQLLQVGLTRDIFMATNALVLHTIKSVYDISESEHTSLKDKECADLQSEAAGVIRLCRVDPSLSKAAVNLNNEMAHMLAVVAAPLPNNKQNAKVNDEYNARAVESFKRLSNATDLVVRTRAAEQVNIPNLLQLSYSRLNSYLHMALCGGILLSLAMAFWFAQTVWRPLTRIYHNSLLLAQQKTLLPALAPGDEISDLDRYIREISYAVAGALAKEQQLIEKTSDMICSINDLGIVNRSNSASNALLGKNSLVGESIFCYIAQDSLARAEQELNWNDCSHPKLIDLKMKSANDSIVETQWSVVRDESSAELFCVVRDVTKETKQKQLKEQFMSTVSEDLRSPLISILSSIRAIQEGSLGSLSEPVNAELNQISAKVQFLLGLVDDLLDFEKISTGQIILNKTSGSVAELIKRALKMVDFLAAEKAIILKSSVNADTITSDSARIFQVLLNLLTNAIKFSPENSIVEILAYQTENRVRFTVSDLGPGIPDDWKDIIFDTFVQLPDSNQGVGLGLSICKNIVTAHGGEIGVTTRKDNQVGSVFWFELPV